MASVYDFSVEGDENFIAGMGGLCCHNTDADVDGIHIRTLLLTFFYRQMPDAHRARPHLHRAAAALQSQEGKQEHYVKDDLELNALLLSTAIDGAGPARQCRGAATVRARARIPGAASTSKFRPSCRRWARRYDERLLEQLIYVPEVNTEISIASTELQGLVPQSRASLERARRCLAPLHESAVQTLAAGRPSHRSAASSSTALSSEKHMPREFFDSAEYLAHRRARADLERFDRRGRLRSARRGAPRNRRASRSR